MINTESENWWNGFLIGFVFFSDDHFVFSVIWLAFIDMKIDDFKENIEINGKRRDPLS